MCTIFLPNRHSSLHEISVTDQQFNRPKLKLFRHLPLTNKNAKSRHIPSPLLPVDTNPVVIQLAWLSTCTFLGLVLNANITTAIQQHSEICIHVSYDSLHHKRAIVHTGHYTTVSAFVSLQLNRTFPWKHTLNKNYTSTTRDLKREPFLQTFHFQKFVQTSQLTCEINCFPQTNT